ncbi:MAG TPA: FAD-binding protein [Terriglobia bacterium]|nr:FAD-binding protein [Terriglobia bacterium]
MGAGRDQKVDFLVIGSGVAGLRAAIDLAAAGSVLMLTKGDSSGSITRQALSGIAAGSGKEEIALHLHETLRSGDGLCREGAVRILVEEGAAQIQQLGEWGARFEGKSGAAASSASGVAKRSRVIRAQDHPIGVEVLQALTAKAKSLSSLRRKSSVMAVDLLLDDQKACGTMYLDEHTGSFKRVHAAAVLLATGGLGQVYAETTNPVGACGDGVALAYRAGALLSDMEFIQFHPTVLHMPKPPLLALPAALREMGAQLRNIELDRFMPRYHEAGELAPPDILTRSILMEMQRARSDFVYLDLTGLDADEVKTHFPKIYAACLDNNIDITSDLVPVRPAAHFAMGGVATNLEGASSLPRLYAAGEAAVTGIHGANRLANNSLLEGLVYGARAAKAMIAGRGSDLPSQRSSPAAKPARLDQGKSDFSAVPLNARDIAAIAQEIRRLMWSHAGIIRHGSKLREAVSRLNAMAIPQSGPPNRQHYEAVNLLEVARLVACCAEARKESRGAHYRADFPLRNDGEPARHSFVSRSSGVYFE